MAKLKIAVVYGGPSREHDVSLKSGRAVISALDRNKYDIQQIEVSRDNQWRINDTEYKLIDALVYLKTHIDFVFIALHGTFGEDGALQQLLEQRRIPFSGSGSTASRLAMYKDQTTKALKDAGFQVPYEKVFSDDFNEREDEILTHFSLPVIVKPVAQGSSFGIAKVDTPAQLMLAMKAALAEDDKVIVQEYISGEEVSAGVIEDEGGNVRALPPTQLIPLRSDFFDFDAKYTKGATNEITPPNLPAEEIKRVQDMAVKVHQIIGCEGYSRTDMIVKKDGAIYVIEINTLPGMTETSILPQQAAAAGLSFVSMLDLIIEAGLRRSGYNLSHE